MEFNTLVKTYLLPILKMYEFEIVEEFKNIIRFQSSVMKVNLVFNDYDLSHFVELGKKEETLFPLNDNVVKEIWGVSSLPIEKGTSRIFVQNLSLLLGTMEGAEILKGNISPLKSIIYQQSENYTSELLQKKSLEAALRAWNTNDFVAFIESIEKVGIDKIPQSYQLKYKIAKQRLSGD